ncbi:AAA family ATPase [Lacticaseibacillus paracasei]|uniref:AAA family ATPase n=2 Tax=Lacticaseibacillus paracasei TaxID=1597 RepID=UPI003980179C
MMAVVNGKKLHRSKNWKVLIYGKPGVGKTSAARELSGKTLLLSLDNSHRVLADFDIDVWKDPTLDPDDESAMFDRIHPNESLTRFLEEHGTNKNDYTNFVIDNVSSLEKDWFVEQGRKSHNKISNEIQDYGMWSNYFSRIMTTILLIPNVNVLVTAWENTRDVTSETGQSFSQYAPAIRDSVRDGLLGLTDVVGRVVISTKTNHRGVILAGSDAIFAKNRLDDRTACAIEDLFKFGGDSDVSASSLPEEAS